MQVRDSGSRAEPNAVEPSEEAVRLVGERTRYTIGGGRLFELSCLSLFPSDLVKFLLSIYEMQRKRVYCKHLQVVR
jgi:hypothetical protein